jgi:hypothetical protein
MSKNWMMLTGLLFLGSVGASQAHPLDSPDIVYIDGLPCNSVCQSYMAWSRRKTSPTAQQSAPVESPRVKPAPEKAVRRSAYSAVHRATAVRREGSKPAVSRIAKQAVTLRPARIQRLQTAGDVAVNSELAPTKVGASPSPDDAAATSKATTVKEQDAAATALAEQVTAANAAPAPQHGTINAEASVHSGAADPSDTEPTISAATDNTDNRVALLMALPEIESVSDLTGRDVAIDAQQSASSASIRAAIASAGAAEVQLNERPMKAIDRLVGGEVPAAVLTLVSPQAAEWFPDIPGFRIFRIPLSPSSLRTSP